jgi:hypothetical protein
MNHDPSSALLPDECLVCVPNGNNAIIGWARRGQHGLRVVRSLPLATSQDAAAYVDYVNRAIGVSGHQAFCMFVGALVGWNHPKADPSRLPSGIRTFGSAIKVDTTCTTKAG